MSTREGTRYDTVSRLDSPPAHPASDLCARNFSQVQLVTIKEEMKPFKAAYADLLGMAKNATSRLQKGVNAATKQQSNKQGAQSVASSNTLPLFGHGLTVGAEAPRMSVAEGLGQFDALELPTVVTELPKGVPKLFDPNYDLMKLEIKAFQEKCCGVQSWQRFVG